MRSSQRGCALVLVLVLAMQLLPGRGIYGQAVKTLREEDILKLIDLQIDDAAIVAKLKKEGVGFAVDESALKRLKDAGASDKLLEAVGAAGKSKPASGGVKAVTYKDVLQLLDLGIGESEILKRLAKSPTIFTFSAEQAAELRKKGASAELLAALQGKRGAASQSSDVTDFIVILDCSGSMKAKTKDGEMKMAVAKRVVTELINNIPDGLSVGFIVYGHEVFSRLDDPRNCEAVKVVRPLSEIDEKGKSELARYIHALQPTGATPIGLALKIAGAELARHDGFSGVVLITDGMESCKGDPGAEAAELAKNEKLTFGLNIIGFDVDGKERAAVEGIAKAAGDKGKYFNAKTAAELKEMVGKVHKELAQATASSPEQRTTRKYTASGKANKPGTFLHDAPLVEPGEFKGTLAMMSAWYYQVAVRKGQELRIVGQVQKTPYQAGNGINHQTFRITVYDSDLAVAAREALDVEGNPTTVSSLRTIWKADADGIVYVAISATENQNKDGSPAWIVGDKQPEPSPYTLRIRVEGDPDDGGEAPSTTARLMVKAGGNFDGAGAIAPPGLVATDLKVGEVVFYRVPVAKGENLRAALTFQKPFYNAGNGAIRATYTVTIYDDDQVQAVQEKLEVEMNPPDAQALSVIWPVTLAGNAYISVACDNSGQGIYPENFDPKPGHIALHVTKPEGDGKPDPFKGAKSDSK